MAKEEKGLKIEGQQEEEDVKEGGRDRERKEKK